MERKVILWILLVGLLNFVIAAAPHHHLTRNIHGCRPLVIAHRGASGYIPEHTLGAYALAITMGADFVEPDLVMTSDGHLIVRHENELSLTTDVADRPEFASRFQNKTIDGVQASGWFSEDFTLTEIKTLRAKELMPTIRPGNTRMDESFEILTLQEIIDLVKGMEISVQRTIGIYPEIKHASHFQLLGLAMEKPLVDILHANRYRGSDAPIYIQSFEVSNLKELKELTDLRLIQLYSSPTRQPYDQVLLGTNLTFAAMATAEGLREVASYAAAVGPDKSYIIPRDAENRLGNATSFVTDAQAAGLLVHPYTFRAENIFLPLEYRSNDNDTSAIGNFRGEISAFFEAGIDGLFSDQPDIPFLMRGVCPSSATSLYFNPVLRIGLLVLSIFYYKS